MTNKIKTHCGTGVEPRVGMDVAVEDFDISFKIARIIQNGDAILMEGFEEEWDEDHWVRPYDCTLMHAPIIEGDEIEVIHHGAWVPMRQNYMNSDRSTSIKFRHKQKEMRDHPEWNKV